MGFPMSSLHTRVTADHIAAHALFSSNGPIEERNTSAHGHVIRKLYQDHAAALRKFVRRQVGWSNSEDLVQEAFLRLLEDKALSDLDCPRAYLFRIAINLAIDVKRRTKVRSSFIKETSALSSLSHVAHYDSSAVGVLALRKIRSLLGELSPLCRQIFLMKCLDITNAEIASRLGVSTRTVERHLVKARAELRKKCAG
jgi:RNA polymerase sigma factor (sigma-70 family)